jgi:spore maturation protein CgeB
MIAGRPSLRLAFFGSSISSAYWNGAATYYRGIVRALSAHGHRVTFHEPRALGRQDHADLIDPDWVDIVVYEAATEDDVRRAVAGAAAVDIVVKTSGVGVFDDLLERAVIDLPGPSARIFWDVDAPATLDGLGADPAHPLRALIPRFDLVLTYGGGMGVVERYRAFGARECIPVYNALDPATHHPAPPDDRFACDLGFLGNRLGDRETRADEFFFQAARLAPHRRFLLGGSGWEEKPMPGNVGYLGHVYTRDHNAFNSAALAVLNVNRESMASTGYSPPTRLFEVAGAAACLISDDWPGIDAFLEPGREVLVAADGEEVAEILAGLTPRRAAAIGAAARRRILSHHTYAHRVALLERVLGVGNGQVVAR